VRSGSERKYGSKWLIFKFYIATCLTIIALVSLLSGIDKFVLIATVSTLGLLAGYHIRKILP